MKIIIASCLLAFAVINVSFAAPQRQISPDAPFAHPAVVINSQMESQLPEELKSQFYRNPRVAAGLAKESWFGNKEMQVLEREAEKIPREKIFSVLHNAGLARRR